LTGFVASQAPVNNVMNTQPLLVLSVLLEIIIAT
jgi:hypothetical protein